MIQVFRIETEPKAQPRPRFARCGSFVKVYEPKEIKDYKELIALSLKEQKAKRIDGPVGLEVDFIFAERKGSKTVDHLKRPDLDNLIKAFLDAANGILWKDDTQIVNITARKFYGESPCIRVSVRSAERRRGGQNGGDPEGTLQKMAG